MIWPPNYGHEADRRRALLLAYEDIDNPREKFVEKYKDDPIAFIQDWCWTYDPRNAMKTSKSPPSMPFLLFPAQKDFIIWLLKCLEAEDDGLVEKSRDMGASWLCCAFSVWLWLFWDESAVGWGSRKEELVDKIGDPKSIFWKIRYLLDKLPNFAMPVLFNAKKHTSYMKIINPDNGSTITGEAGKNIGRGGRTLIYFKDESAHYDQAESIEAALGDNTNVQIEISSVNGTGNVFYRKRHDGITQIFILDWRDHPAKTQKWYDARKEKAEAQGLYHIFAQEVDRDYSASIEGVLIPSKWVKAAIDAHIKLGIEAEGKKQAGLDVADEGGDTNALIFRHGIVLYDLDEWGDGDTSETARKAYLACKEHQTSDMNFDAVGVGAGVKAECNKIEKEDKTFKAYPYMGQGELKHPDRNFTDGIKNKDIFDNRKAQDYWHLRTLFHETYKAVNGKDYDKEALISISSKCPKYNQLVNELSQPIKKNTASGKMVVDKKPKGHKSPNLADAAVMAYADTRKKTLRMAFS